MMLQTGNDFIFILHVSYICTYTLLDESEKERITNNAWKVVLKVTVTAHASSTLPRNVR